MAVTLFERLAYQHDVLRKKSTEGWLEAVPDGREDFSVKVTIDMEALARVAKRAGSSKLGKSICGPLTVVVIDRQKAQNP